MSSECLRRKRLWIRMSVDDTHQWKKAKKKANEQINNVYFHRFGIGVRRNKFILSFFPLFPYLVYLSWDEIVWVRLGSVVYVAFELKLYKLN